MWDRRSIGEQFEEWIRTGDGRKVFAELVTRAKYLRRIGWKHYSHKAIIESIRYDNAISVGPDHGFRINDHYTSRLARLAMDVYPELDGFFEVRELRS